MALNWAMLDARRLPVPLPNEHTIITVDSQVEYALAIPDRPQGTGNIDPRGVKRMKETGRLWLTDQRLVFTTPGGGKLKPSFDSLSIPLPSILSTKFEQPFFGANYLAMDVKPSADGGLNDGTVLEIRFNDRGIFEFVNTLEKTRERAIYMKRQSSLEEDEGLPVYTSSAGPSAHEDMPPGYDG
ncbi:hypothetical protein BJ138DRAFT_230392 [Hygrophoropsis aurantiaca]|uniref:Uncharacterized protein n=1 Tax=Hygrophoropsis aurantiaca TaxID=72124 RepID=A0ACB8A868_9AGAM|nr:hypothetical protein BJ138DRAFT_230392 [Hygrophoropsis aurantiaca]